MNNDKLISISGGVASILSFIISIVAIFKDYLLGGIILAGASLATFLVVFIFYVRRHRLKELFKEVEAVNFCNQLNVDDISAIDIMAHTGANLVDPLFAQFERSAAIREKFQQIHIRILLRNPNAEIERRAKRVKQIVERIREYQNRGFNHLFLQFYEDLPTFRSIICYSKPPYDQPMMAFLSFYYFPDIDSISKKYPRSLVVNKNIKGGYQLLELYESWFNYFWGKNKTGEQKIHTLILDFDDTIVDSHELQVDAWMQIIKEAQSEHNLTDQDFNENIREKLHDEIDLKNEVTKIFFNEQDAQRIFPKIFSQVESDLQEKLHQRRFDIRKQKFEEQLKDDKIFINCKRILCDLFRQYNLIIVSATDEDLIIKYLSAQRLPANAPAGKKNLYGLFRYVFGKQEATFDWRNMKRKSKLIIKIINILGIPLERMVYVGDNNGDFEASHDIGIRFVEARLFPNKLMSLIGKQSLIFNNKHRLYFTDWDQFPGILERFDNA